MEEVLTVSEVKKRLISSFLSLSARQAVLMAVNFITLNVVLARALPVATLGVFNIATSIIAFFSFFSDIGLAASLIQKKDAVSGQDIKTVFTIQSLIVGVLSLLIVVLAPFLAELYKLDEGGVWLIRVLGITFFLSSLKVLPSVMLERHLKFKPLVSVEVSEAVAFNALLIIGVLMGWGLWSFSVAALSRGLLGVLLIYIVSPVAIGLGVSLGSAGGLLKFGVPFQINNLLALLKDRLIPLVVAGMVGAQGVGFITWAQSMSFLPLTLMNIIIRISFPAFSRLQHDSGALSKGVEKAIFATTFFTYPMVFGLSAIMPFLVKFVVSPKWTPALESYYLFAFATLWSIVSTTLTNALNAVGKIGVTLKLMIMWTVLEWTLTPVLVWKFGFLGVAIASFVISFSSVLAIVLAKRILSVGVVGQIKLPLLASLLMGGAVYFYSSIFVVNGWMIATSVVLGVVVYATVMYAVMGRSSIDMVNKLIRND